MSKSEVENMTMAQKKMAAMIMEGKQVPEAAVESGAVSKEADEAEMQMSDDEADQHVKNIDKTSAGQQGARAATNAANGPVKVSLPKLSSLLNVLLIRCAADYTDSQRLCT